MDQLQQAHPNISSAASDARLQAEFAGWFQNFVSFFLFLI